MCGSNSEQIRPQHAHDPGSMEGIDVVEDRYFDYCIAWFRGGTSGHEIAPLPESRLHVVVIAALFHRREARHDRNCIGSKTVHTRLYKWRQVTLRKRNYHERRLYLRKLWLKGFSSWRRSIALSSCGANSALFRDSLRTCRTSICQSDRHIALRYSEEFLIPFCLRHKGILMK